MKSILIIEDEPDIQELLRAYLEGAGYQTTVAGDGVAAWTLFQSRPFDLVLLDPPFRRGLLAQVLPALQDKLAPGGVILAESEREAQLPERVGALVCVKQYHYGKIMVSRYEREGQP